MMMMVMKEASVGGGKGRGYERLIERINATPSGERRGKAGG